MLDTFNHSTVDSAAETDLERCRNYLVYQFSERERPKAPGRLHPPGPAVAIAYETGAGAHETARALAPLLQAFEPRGASPWTVFDRELVERVLEEHRLPKTLARFLPEERRSFIRDVMEELVGLRPPSWVVEPLVAESILHLVDAGHVILVGRGASVITARMPSVFRVRLIASLERRIERVQKNSNLTREEAARLVAKSDRERLRYVKAYFHGRPDNELLYHVILNTDLLSPAQAAEVIVTGAHLYFQECKAV